MTTTLEQPATAQDVIGHAVVREAGEWGEFFWRHGERRDGDRVRHDGTFSAVTSFGEYGYHWSHMGQPFPAFAASIGTDYLLSKISRKDKFDEAKFLKWLRREIFTSGATREQKRDAADSLRTLRLDWHGEALSHMAYADADISHCVTDWTDCDSRSWDPQAVGFVAKLWPAFVARLNSTP